MAKFDINRLSRLDRVVVGAAVVALVTLFLPWYGVTYGSVAASVSGWHTGYGWLGAALIFASGAYLASARLSAAGPGRRPLAGSMRPAFVVAALAAGGTLLIVIRWAVLPSGQAAYGGATFFSYGPRVGIFLAMAAGVVATVAAVVVFRGSGERAPWSR